VSFEWQVLPNTPPDVTGPGDQVNEVGDAVSLPLAASDPDGDALTFSASGLPLGLSVDPDTGEISGTLLGAGIRSVVVGVSDGIDTAETSFTWTVQTRKPGVAYEYYEVSDLSVLPDFDVLTPVLTGFVSNFDISARERDEGFAFRFTGLVDVPADGVWTFSTRSDDGSQLFIDGTLVVDNDGQHPVRERSGQVALSAGSHDIVVTMFEWIGSEVLEVFWEGPGVAEQPIPNDRLFSWSTQAPWRPVWSCGLGPELALLLPGLVWLRQRKRVRGTGSTRWAGLSPPRGQTPAR
jgi:hypothetical protein